MKRMMQGSLAAAVLAVAACTPAANAPIPAGYTVTELVGPSAFHGIHGVAVEKDGTILVGSVVGASIFAFNPATKEITTRLGPPDGMADDIAFAPDGTMAWTGFLTGKVFVQKPGGAPVQVAEGLPGANSLAFSKEGKLYFTQVFLGDALYEADVTGKTPPRKIAEKLGGLNGFQVGADGFIYGPLWFKGVIARVDPKTGRASTLASGFKIPAAANFDSQGNLWAIDTQTGQLFKIDMKTRQKTMAAELSPALDNLAIDNEDRVVVTNMADNAILRFDPKTGQTETLIAGKLAVAADLSIARGADAALHLADVFAYRTIDPATGAISEKLRMYKDVLENPIGIGAGPKHVVLVGQTSVQIVDRASGQSLAMLHGFKGPVDGAETADGRILVLDTAEGVILALEDLKGEKRTVVASGLTQPVAMALDGKGGAVVTQADGAVVRVDLATDAKTTLAAGLKQPEGVDVAPDGRVIVAEVGAGRVVAIDAKGGVTALAEGLKLGLPAPAGAPVAFVLTGVAVDDEGVVYVSSDVTNAILKLTPPTQP